jgi:SEC-C motif-containing protein
MSMNHYLPCPCGTKQPYAACCGAFIEDKAIPTTPEQLMRSRFTAYAIGRLDYIEKTMRGKALKVFQRQEAHGNESPIQWLDLTIINAPTPSADEGTVEFLARYRLNGTVHELHENSQFQLHKKRWFYTDKIKH